MVHMLVRMTMMMKMMTVIPSSSIMPKLKTTVRMIIVSIVPPASRSYHQHKHHLSCLVLTKGVNEIHNIRRVGHTKISFPDDRYYLPRAV